MKICYKMNTEEKNYRLSKEFYKAEISAAFTLCLNGNVREFIEPEIVRLKRRLKSAATD